MKRRKKNKTVLHLLAAALIVLLAAGIGRRFYLRQQQPPEEKRTAYVVHRIPVSFSISQRGVLESTDQEPAVVRTQGYIQEIVEQGTPVKKGDFIFRMDDTDPREDLEQYQDSVGQEMLSKQISEETLSLTRFREEQELSVLDAELEHARLSEAEELAKPVEQDRRLSAIDKRLAELDLEDARDVYERQRRLFDKGFLSATALEPYEKRVHIAEAYVEEVERRIEIEAEGISEERRIELRRAVERAEAVGERAKRRMARRVQEIEEELKLNDLRVQEIRHRMTREQEEIDGAEVRSGKDGLVKIRQYRDWRSGGRLMEYKAGVQKYPLDIIADVINPHVMTVKLVINEADFHFLSEGMPVKVILPAFPGQTFAGKLIQLGAIGQERNRVDPTARSGGQSEIVMFSAAISFDGGGAEFRPGMSALVEIIVAEPGPRLVIPRCAVTCSEQGTTVLAGPGPEPSRQPIQGRVFNQFYFLVESGLSEGDTIWLPDKSMPPQAAEAMAGVAGRTGDREADTESL